MQTHAHSHKGNAKAKARRPNEHEHEPSVLEQLEAILDTVRTQARHNAPITPEILNSLEEIVALARHYDKRDE